jgi:hypothetical protein
MMGKDYLSFMVSCDELRQDNGESTFFTMEICEDGYIYITTDMSYFNDTEMVMVVKLPASCSETLREMIYDNGVKLRNIQQDGIEYEKAEELEISEDLDKNRFELGSYEDLVKIGGRVKVDFQNKTVEVYTDKFETAEGISVEQSEITIEMWSVEEENIDVTTALGEPLKNGTVTKIDYSSTVNSDPRLTSGYLSYWLNVKLRDGTERVIIRNVYCSMFDLIGDMNDLSP